MSALIPEHSGLLPYFLLTTAAMALIHTVVCYTGTPETALRAFSGPKRPPPTALLAHVYGTKNVYTALIRIYAAYYITNPQIYSLGMISFAGPLLLYSSELFIYQTTRPLETSWPFVVAGGGLLWMYLQQDFYLA